MTALTRWCGIPWTPSERRCMAAGWTCHARGPFSQWTHPTHGEVYRSRDHCWRWTPAGRVVPDDRQWRTLGAAARAAVTGGEG